VYYTFVFICDLTSDDNECRMEEIGKGTEVDVTTEFDTANTSTRDTGLVRTTL